MYNINNTMKLILNITKCHTIQNNIESRNHSPLQNLKKINKTYSKFSNLPNRDKNQKGQEELTVQGHSGLHRDPCQDTFQGQDPSSCTSENPSSQSGTGSQCASTMPSTPTTMGLDFPRHLQRSPCAVQYSLATTKKRKRNSISVVKFLKK